jgi:hypothetical protein
VGFPVSALRTAGFTSQELKETSVTLLEMKEGGYTPEQLREAAYSVKEMKEVGYSCTMLLEAGYKAAKLLLVAEFTHNELREGGVTAKEMRKITNFLPSQLRAEAGLDDEDDIFVKRWDASMWRRDELTWMMMSQYRTQNKILFFLLLLCLLLFSFHPHRLLSGGVGNCRLYNRGA